MTDDDAWGALAELVRLKDVKEALIPLVGAPDGFLSPEATILREDYDTHQPVAWQRARDALDRHAMHLADVEARRACPDCGHPCDGHDKVVGCLDGWSGDRTGPGCPCRATAETWEMADLARLFATLQGPTIVPPAAHEHTWEPVPGAIEGGPAEDPVTWVRCSDPDCPTTITRPVKADSENPEQTT